MKMPLVTVIMPSLNVAVYIKEAVSSVLHQTLENIEIICVDAGSTDGTREILEEFSRVDQRLKIIDAEKRSYGHQMNLGIQQAQGKYIGVVETDDFVDREMFRTLYEIAERTDAEVVKSNICKYKCIDGKEYYDVEYNIDRHFYTREVVSAAVFPELHDQDRWVTTGIYRSQMLREHAIRYNESPGAAYQDIGFLHLTLFHAKRIAYTERAYYFYRQNRKDSSSNRPFGLHHLYAEYQRLFANEIATVEENRRQNYWMANNFADKVIFEYDHMLRFCNYHAQEEYTGAPCIWLMEKLKALEAEGTLAFERQRETRWLRLRMLLYHPESYPALIMESDRINDVKEVMKYSGIGEDLVVFGYGTVGKRVMRELYNREISVCAVCDNDISLQNERAGRLPIMSPQECAEAFPDQFYLIANRNHGEDMKRQLLSEGIKEEKIQIIPF